MKLGISILRLVRALGGSSRVRCINHAYFTTMVLGPVLWKFYVRSAWVQQGNVQRFKGVRKGTLPAILKKDLKR